MGLFKKIWSGVKDVAKVVSYVVAAPVNSVTGHSYNPDYETDFGNAVGQVIENSVDNQHALLKGFADGLLGGLPTRIANKFRSPENRESPGHYRESDKDYGNKFLNWLNNFSVTVGGIYGSKSASGGATSPPPGNTPNVNQQPSAFDSGTFRFLAFVVGIFLIVALIIRKL